MLSASGHSDKAIGMGGDEAAIFVLQLNQIAGERAVRRALRADTLIA